MMMIFMRSFITMFSEHNLNFKKSFRKIEALFYKKIEIEVRNAELNERKIIIMYFCYCYEKGRKQNKTVCKVRCFIAIIEINS